MDRYNSDDLKHWTTAVLQACLVPRQNAEIAAGVLMRTSLRGIDTHGVSRLAGYVSKLQSGEVRAQAHPVALWCDGALQVDGDGGLGQIVASFAVDEALARAERLAAVSCVIRDSGHLSALGLYALQAAERGFIALLCQKTPPIMALPGSTSAAIGNNPIAFAAPIPHQPPLVFDMANSVVARGQVMQAFRDGTSIRNEWALGPDGAPTTDPALALQGAMRPVAAHKGIGLAMMVECLAGSLSAAIDADRDQRRDAAGSASGVGAFLLVINPGLFVARQVFETNMDEWMQRYLHAAGPQARYPGQRQAECEVLRRSSGIPIPDSVLRELREAGQAIGLPFELSHL